MHPFQQLPLSSTFLPTQLPKEKHFPQCLRMDRSLKVTGQNSIFSRSPGEHPPAARLKSGNPRIWWRCQRNWRGIVYGVPLPLAPLSPPSHAFIFFFLSLARTPRPVSLTNGSTNERTWRLRGAARRNCRYAAKAEGAPAQPCSACTSPFNLFPLSFSFLDQETNVPERDIKTEPR